MCVIAFEWTRPAIFLGPSPLVSLHFMTHYVLQGIGALLRLRLFTFHANNFSGMYDRHLADLQTEGFLVITFFRFERFKRVNF